MTTTFEQQAQLKSAGITLGIVVALFLLLYFIPYSISKMVQPEEEMGMLVNLGNSEDGSGDVQPISDADNTEESSAKAHSTAATQTPDAVNTQETEDAPSVETPKKVNPSVKPITKKPIENPKPDPEKVEAERIAKELAEKKAKQEAFRNKLKGALNHPNSSVSEGEGKGTNDQGVKNGDPNAKNHFGENTGPGTAGAGWSIKGKIGSRGVRKRPVINDNSKEEGKVAVDITVDDQGNVINAKYTEKGSSTSSAYLRGLALKAAKDIKFNPKQDADEETGTIIFRFKNS
jgi:TonB family protein